MESKILLKFITIFLVISMLIFVFPMCAHAEENKKISYKLENGQNNNDNNKENICICKYKEGEVIVTYEKEDFLSTLNIKNDSLFDSYDINETIVFNDIVLDKNNKNAISIGEPQNKENTTALAMSLIKSTQYTTKELIEIFKEKDWVIAVEPNYTMKTSSLTNDPYTQYQWAIDNSGQSGGTEGCDINPFFTTSKQEKVIAIVDSGVDYTHEDLKNIMWKNPHVDLEGTYGYDFFNNDDDPMDDFGHGTHVAGIIAAEANNEIGISGTVQGAPNIKIMALKVGDEYGFMDAYAVLKAYNYIYQAQQLGTSVIAINNSWGGFAPLDERLSFNEEIEQMNSLNSVIDLAGEQGALSICAAGNDGMELDERGETYIDGWMFEDWDDPTDDWLLNDKIRSRFFPAGLDTNYIITVGATTKRDKIATFSNYGNCVDIAAPGCEILSTTPSNLYNTGKIGKKFIPCLCNEYQSNDMWKEYFDFEDEDLDSIETKFIPTTGTISVTDEKSFATGEKSLKWEFDVLEDGENPFLSINLDKQHTSPDSVLQAKSFRLGVN